MRFTKIICTLGPASKTKDQISALADAGMNVARLNMSHGTQDGHRAMIHLIKEINQERAKAVPYKHCIAILIDIRGAEVRTEDVKETLIIKKGEEVVFSFLLQPDEKRQVVQVNHKGFANDVRKAERIILDNGDLTFDIGPVDTKKGTVLAIAREDGKIGSRRHVNLPGADLDLPSITDKDWDDIAFGIVEGVDFFGLSFIREAWEVEEVRKFLEKKNSKAHLVAKIETRQGVENITSITQVSDGIMVARGDLGAEVPFERLPVIQDEIVLECRNLGKPVIVATHMLESMIQMPMPTRAEITDIAHAATTGSDCTMLSGETANGKHPHGAVVAMDKVLRATEEHLARFPWTEQQPVENEREARAHAAVSLSITDHAAALVIVTRTGKTAREIAKFRPRVSVIAVTDREEVQRQLQLVYGVAPIHTKLSEDPEETVLAAIKEGKRLGLLQDNSKFVLVSDAKAGEVSINSIQMRTTA